MGAAAARAQKAQAEAGLGMSGTLLSYGRIVAPEDGVVTRKWMDPGNLAYPGAPILTLEDPADLELSVQVPEERARTLAVGQGASVTVDALGKSFEVPLSAVVGAADPVSRTSLVKLGIPSGTGILPGQFARVRFAAFSQRALTVPTTALVERGQMDAVFVAESGVVHQRYIQTGLRSGDRVQVLAGLRAGESVVAPVPAGLSDGTKVEAGP
jgi:RND family efflux transporter MFP subunit